MTPAPTPAEIVGCTPGAFESLAERVLAFQRAENPVYARFAQTGRFLPVDAFKHQAVATFPPDSAERVFTSSGTGSGVRARHFVRHLSYYDASIDAGFQERFGPGRFRVLAHLPHYAEDSSLVYMVRRLIDRFGAPGSGFFLGDSVLLEQALANEGAPILLFGAAFGLLDLAEAQSFSLPADARLIETGGMKTHRRSVSREELHRLLSEGFGVSRERIWSEYGMCEMLSQAWSRGEEPFLPPPWMRVEIFDPEDPLRPLERGRPGLLAVLDLANVHSASALLTQDRAVISGQGFFVLGRMSGAELRGCNHLMESL